MQGRRLFSIAICAVAVAAGAVGCSDIGLGDGTDPGVGDPSGDAGTAPTAPATTLPLTQTPEYVASNTPCPQGLTELGAVPLAEAAPERSVSLAPFIDLVDATVTVFDTVHSDAEAAGADSDADAVAERGELRGFVGDRQGRIWRFAATGPGGAEPGGAESGSSSAPAATLGDEPVADFSSNTAAEHDQGLVGMTLGPHGRLWINRTNRHGDSLLTVLTPTADRIRLEGGHADVLEVAQTNAQHNGGDLLFDPDGLLYVSFGDGGGLGDPRGHGQNLTTPLGSVLRLALDTNDSADADDWQLLPAPGNPDLGPGSDPRIWAYGARNPYRISLDETSSTLWVTDVGQQCVEEVNALALDEGGANLGWNSYEGSRRFVGDDISDHRAPDLEYRHGRGLCAVIGGHVYRGSQMEWLTGRYVFADLCGGDIYAAAVEPGTAPDSVWHLGVSTPRPVGFATDGAGELYVIDIETGVWRLKG